MTTRHGVFETHRNHEYYYYWMQRENILDLFPVLFWGLFWVGLRVVSFVLKLQTSYSCTKDEDVFGLIVTYAGYQMSGY